MINSSVRLRAQSLAKSFGDTDALESVSIDISQAGVVAILGQNGAGKTTFIRCALGFERPSGGSIELCGHRAGRLKARLGVGVMLQGSDLPDLLTARELITLFASYYRKPLAVEEALTLTNVTAFADKLYKKLSGGQKRRVQFALAAVGNTDILFLDEPTTGLDIESRKNLWAVVKRFAREGKTVVLTTHYLEEADALADRIVVFERGKILADGTASDIRDRLGHTRICCQTQLCIDSIRALPDCTKAERSDRISIIHTTNSAVTLRALLSQDPNLSELTVSPPSLDDIFSESTT